MANGTWPTLNDAAGRTSTTLNFATPKLRSIGLPHPFSQALSRIWLGAS